ncbi:MAG: hypothetical protein V5A34_06980, partial [Halapricum sp.]
SDPFVSVVGLDSVVSVEAAVSAVVVSVVAVGAVVVPSTVSADVVGVPSDAGPEQPASAATMTTQIEAIMTAFLTFIQGQMTKL